MTELERHRRQIIQDFAGQRPHLLAELRKLSRKVIDVRLMGSVLDHKRFNRNSDVDMAIIITGPAPSLMRRLYQDRFQEAVILHGKNGLILLDPISMFEGEWEEWSRGRAA